MQTANMQTCSTASFNWENVGVFEALVSGPEEVVTHAGLAVLSHQKVDYYDYLTRWNLFTSFHG